VRSTIAWQFAGFADVTTCEIVETPNGVVVGLRMGDGKRSGTNGNKRRATLNLRIEGSIPSRLTTLSSALSDGSTPAMLKHLERRAAGMGRSVTARIMDARRLAFPDSSFDAVVMHLILAVMPEPERGLREAARTLKPGGRIAVLDKFLRDEEHPSLKRRLLNVLAKPLFSDLNRRLGPLIAGTPLVIEHDEPVSFGGAYRVVTLMNGDQ
jgi:Methyltransferase domain